MKMNGIVFLGIGFLIGFFVASIQEFSNYKNMELPTKSRLLTLAKEKCDVLLDAQKENEIEQVVNQSYQGSFSIEATAGQECVFKFSDPTNSELSGYGSLSKMDAGYYVSLFQAFDDRLVSEDRPTFIAVFALKPVLISLY